MVKRPTDSDSDGSQAQYEKSPKRAKTQGSDSEDSDGDFHDVTNRSQIKGKGKAKANAKTGLNEEVEEHGDTDNEVAEQEFEAAHSKKILEDLAAKRKIQGGIAEHGIIERVEMVNFMCHPFLKFEFGPQINFIIGHNGSGKSAVLSAITVALGGKSASTGRGTGLKSFIKEGCQAAEVTIYLKNQGEEAYKHEEYGDSIIISRRFTKEGSSTWKIRGKNSTQTISNKKEELSAICDHMNIQVDNPLNVLTQDAARQFLSASAPSDKYKFFLRGTQLSQLSEEYSTCLTNIKQTFKILSQKKEAIPDLRAAFKEASIRFQEAAKAREQKEKADELKKELAWAHVRGKEAEMEKQFKEIAKQEARLPKIQKSIEAAEIEFQAATEEVERYENRVAAVGNMDELLKEKDRLQALIKINREHIVKFTNELKDMDRSMNAIDQQVKEFDRKIDEETRRMAANTQAKHDETQRKIEEARMRVQTSRATLEGLTRDLQEQEAKTGNLKADGEKFERETVGGLRAKIQDCEGMIQRARDAEKNRYHPYGVNIKGVLDAIKNERWTGEAPVGPLGLFITVKDRGKWGELLSTQLGQYLTAFAVTTNSDRIKLKTMLDQSKNYNTQIIINSRDMFDYSRGEPPEGCLTALRALEISDDYVLRVLINMAKIERILLAYTRSEGQEMLEKLGGGVAWTSEKFLRVQVFPEGGNATNPLQRNRGRNDATSLLLTGRDMSSEIIRLQQQLTAFGHEYHGAMQESHGHKNEWSNERAQLDALKRQHSNADDALRRAKMAYSTVQQTAIDDMPSNISSYQAAKEEAEKEKAHYEGMAADVLRQKKEHDEKNRALMPEIEEVKGRIKEFNQEKNELVSKAADAAEQRLKAQHSKDSYLKKLNDEKAAIAKLQQIADVLQEEYTNWTDKALEYCERVPNPRNADVVKRNLESVQQALKEREKRHGATVEEMTIEVNKARAKLEAAERDLKQMSTLNKVLKNSLTTRLQRWQDFRRHIALRCKLVFGYHLSHRGYYGKVLFNHEVETLVLKVVTDDQAATQQATQTQREKDPRSLSGGEKSFSTICLLLSLWESIGCPLRCLDEFDVFMDAVNRRISMKMMIDTANSSDKKQYILITPQDMGNVQLGPTVKVNRMTDPERRNQT